MYIIIIFIIIIIAIAILFRKPKADKDGVIRYGEFYSDLGFKDDKYRPLIEQYDSQPQIPYGETPIREPKQTAPTPAQEKRENSEKYEEFISHMYKANGYIVWQYSKERGKADRGIDLIAKKDDEIVFIQCKNNLHKIKEINLKATRIDVIDYLEEYPQFQPYRYKIECIATEDIFHMDAKKYAREKGHILELKIIPHQKQ